MSPAYQLFHLPILSKPPRIAPRRHQNSIKLGTASLQHLHIPDSTQQRLKHPKIVPELEPVNIVLSLHFV
nr:MAG TPA: hypothetical protein [Caudoviricetes sp.]